MTGRPRVLFVDDDPTMRQAARLVLRDYELETLESPAEALALIRAGSHDLVLTDLFMPGPEEGFALVAEARRRDPEVAIAVISGFATIAAAVEAVKRGADDFIAKESDADSLHLQVDRILSRRQEKTRLRQLEAENAVLKEELLGRERLLGDSPAMRDVRDRIELAARDGETTVLLLGKSGTGKDLAARAIHERSPRRSRPFIAIDCPAIPKDLFESELFGHERGAFTDAKEKKLGRLELAQGGTLFLDEVAELPPALQAKLLRFLETGEFYRVGGSQPVRLDVRILSSTNRDLREMVAAGSFRGDLFFRLQVVVISLPELRERGEDIVLLAEHFLAEFNARKAKRLRFSPEQLRRLQSYGWPGNVRELRHAVESFCVLGEFPYLHLSELPGTMNYKEARRTALEAFDRDFLASALNRHAGNITRAARSIGISREELSRKLGKFRKRP